jgi:hypothetical protein
VREEILARDYADDGALMGIANTQVSETLRTENVEALFDVVVGLHNKGMLLDIRPNVHQLVQVLVYYILEHVFAVRIFLVETRQDVPPTDLFIEWCGWETSLFLVIVGCVLLVRFLQCFRIEQLFLLVFVWV